MRISIRSSLRYGQSGASLVVVLVLLIAMTLVGVFVLRGTLLEERMSASVLDRSIAFQAAESALREAEAAIHAARTTGASIGFNCSRDDPSTPVCPTLPPNAYTGTAGACTANTQNCWVSASANAVSSATLSTLIGSPQYYIEYMGQRTSSDDLGQLGSANTNQYGGGGGVPIASFYRVSARSNNPVLAAADGRALVVLQATVVAK